MYFAVTHRFWTPLYYTPQNFQRRSSIYDDQTAMRVAQFAESLSVEMRTEILYK